ncbi:hypothetical protein GCM10029992_15700 [Glycomyces albus]
MENHRSVPDQAPATRAPGRRTYLMCRPAYYAVEYAINPWMDTAAPVDAARACSQWETLAATYTDLGHEVLYIEPEPGLPDMVYAANGAFVVDGIAYGARFRHPERRPEADSHEKWYRAAGRAHVKPEHTNEGEGDFTYLPGPGLILAGWGFRTDARAHAEAADVFGRQVVSLRLTDPRYYHLDTALAPSTTTTSPITPKRSPPAAAGSCSACSPKRSSPTPKTRPRSASTSSPTAPTSWSTPRRPGWPPSSARPATNRSRSTCPNSRRAAAQPSAAPPSSGPNTAASVSSKSDRAAAMSRGTVREPMT